MRSFGSIWDVFWISHGTFDLGSLAAVRHVSGCSVYLGVCSAIWLASLGHIQGKFVVILRLYVFNYNNVVMQGNSDFVLQVPELQSPDWGIGEV